MKLALFFSLSLVLHAAAFLVPVSLNGRATDRAITVTILPLDTATEQSGGAQVAAKRVGSKKPGAAISNDQPGDYAPSRTPLTPDKLLVDAPSVVADKSVASIAGALMAGVSNSSGDLATGSSQVGGNGLGAAPLGPGSGNGEGSATGQAGITRTQARYRETPQPHYPDIARREGKEGRVLLRVLVDEEGRTKAIEVNASSGHGMLDQAATEAIKKWRFVPARADGKPVETWVKVPIDFQLSNAQP